MPLKLTIQYDGRPYQGWQKQPSAPTVQGFIEKAIEKIAKQPVVIHGAGRTDTGVHAKAQVAHFEPPENVQMNPYNWVPALNNKLPSSIRIMECEEAPADFHSRFCAKEKIYSYRLSRSPVFSPFDVGLAWHLPRQLNLEDLEQAISIYEGTHDFRNLAALRGNETEGTSYERTITSASVSYIDDTILITYRGNGFLYKMVRILTGLAVHVAQGKVSLADQKLYLDPSVKPRKPPYCARADGLVLEKIFY